MIALNVCNLSMEFGGKPLFFNVSFMLDHRDRAGLIGANGTGKTTLFKIITGELKPTGGGVVKLKDVTVGYMEQHACKDSQRTVYDELLSVFEPIIKIESELEKIADSIHTASGAELDGLISRQNLLTEQFERMDGLTYAARTRSTLLGLGFAEADFSLPCSVLSGGQRSKLSLGKLLLSGSDIILLDEPTNHLDISSVEWLEGFISEYKGAVIVISHDRYFLDKVTTKTFEMSNGKLTVWQGNYSASVKQREEKMEIDRRHYENKMAEIKRIEGIIEQQRRFGRERNFITAESKRKMLERKQAELVEPEAVAATLKFKFTPNTVSGNEVLTVRNLSKSFENKPLFRDISMLIKKSDRAFIIGPNGCGKTTLLKIIVRRLAADSGSFLLGANVQVGYFDQTLENVNSDKTVLDEIWDEHRNMDQTQVRSALAAFLFRGDEVFKSVSTLSGGERARIALLKLMLSGANFLVLDEPTNHLDITSREALERALMDFDGTILAVSHDRYFINTLSTRVFYMTQNGLRQFDGNYDKYVEEISQIASKKEPKPVKVNEYKLMKERAGEQRRLKGKIKRCEEEIERVEQEIEAKNSELSQPEVASDYSAVLTLTQEISELNLRQEQLMEDWEELQSQLIEE
ncbi:MAG: ABC-F family ATP-binding cassette domain-containing protein [Clostridiales bacterium]|nr:ABC-F family ATP-binding cassette domain-containing protein [Clostridiales bacterium]